RGLRGAAPWAGAQLPPARAPAPPCPLRAGGHGPGSVACRRDGGGGCAASSCKRFRKEHGQYDRPPLGGSSPSWGKEMWQPALLSPLSFPAPRRPNALPASATPH
uniref:Uncharacterized protein n=1 Tax=Nothoprocta perdicaria TaxID=30464 RepID=A0A8C6YUB6_NOTPE